MFDYIKAHLIEFAFWIALALTPIRPAMLTVLALIGVDLVTGILAARKRGEAIQSLGMRRTVGKLFAYEGALVLSFMVETNLLGGAIPLVKAVGAWIGATELKSNAENLYALTGVDVWKALLARLQGAPTDPTTQPPPSPTDEPSKPSQP